MFLIGKGSNKDGHNSVGKNFVIEVDERNFEEEVINKSLNVPVLVDVWSTRCVPCRTLGPVLEKLAEEGKGRFILTKLDADQNQELIMMMGVRSVPTVILFKDGKPVDGFTGAIPENEVRKFLAKHVPMAESDEEESEEVNVEKLLAEGSVKEARKLFEELDDKNILLEIRILMLEGETKKAKKIIDSAKDGADDSLGELISVCERWIEFIENRFADNSKIIDAFQKNELRCVLDLLLEKLDQNRKRLFLDLLLLMGRGELSEEYRAKFAKLVLS